MGEWTLIKDEVLIKAECQAMVHGKSGRRDEDNDWVDRQVVSHQLVTEE